MIKKLNIYGLKAIKELKLELKELTKIKGRNGVGKSTIKDAISFVLYGKISNTDRIDDAINADSERAKVSMVANLNGKDYIIERERTTRGSKPTINGRDSEQSDINALFGDHDEFICSNFVGEFMKFSEADRRELLMSKFPSKGRDKLFEELTGQDPSLYNLYDLDKTEKDVKKKFKEVEAERNLLSSKKEMLSEDLFRTQEHLKELKSRELKDVSYEIAQAKNELDKILKNSVSYSAPSMPNTSDIDKGIEKVRSTIDLLVRNMPNDNDAKVLKGSIINKKAELERVENSTVCPTCKREYDNISDNKNQADKLKAEILSEYNEWKQLDAEYNDKVQTYKAQMEALEKEKENLETKKKALSSEYDQAVQIAKDKYEEETKSVNQKVTELNALITSLSEKDNEFRTQKMKIEAQEDRVEELTNQINRTLASIKSKDSSMLESVMKAFGPKGIKFQEILSQQKAVNKLLPKGIEIEFMKENKTNEGFKPCFNVISNGFSYQWLSTGMKLEVDMILLSLFDRGFMAVIDNYEGYTGKLSENLKGKQVITLSAGKGELTINNK